MATYPRVLRRTLDVIFYVLIGATVLTVLVVGAMFVWKSPNVDLVVPVAFVPDAETVTLHSDVYGDGEITMAQGVASFEEVGGPGRVVQAIAIVAVFLIPAFVILHMLRRLVRTVAEGSPFQGANVTRIRIIGLAIVVFELLYGVTNFLLQRSVASGATASGVQLAANFSVDPAVIVVGLVIFALAEVFRYGGSLQAESDLTV